ncbi:MAG: hypothetical protein FJY20_08750 [Bacteroidetes bacterium]|nr:hypothetical protein [Bacteroidota bacterium]
MRLIWVVLFFNNLIQGQKPDFGNDSAALKIMDRLPAAEPFDTAHRWKKAAGPYQYIIRQNDLYDYFGWRLYVLYMDFDFANYHILGIKQCRQCLEYCRHETGGSECHRNICREDWVWRMRDNKKAFTEIPSVTFPGHAAGSLPGGQKYFLHDTVMVKEEDSTLAAWYTHAGGDCCARFEYRLFRDNYYPAVLLKEWNYYGGCRAGGFWDFTIRFQKPPGTDYFIKRTILMDKQT